MLQYLPVDTVSVIIVALTPIELFAVLCTNKILLAAYMHIIIPYLNKNENKISMKEFKTFLQIYLKKQISTAYEARYTSYVARHQLARHTNIQLFKNDKVCKKKDLLQAIKREMGSLTLHRVRKFSTDTELDSLILGMYGVNITPAELMQTSSGKTDQVGSYNSYNKVYS